MAKAAVCKTVSPKGREFESHLHLWAFSIVVNALGSEPRDMGSTPIMPA